MVFIAVACVSCKKDKVEKESPNALTEKQKEALNILPGKWGMDPDYYTSSDNVFYVFHQPSDTNILVYEDDYINGPQVLYRYQGVVTYIWMSHTDPTDTVSTSDKFYFVNSDATYLTYYMQYTHSISVNRYELKVTDQTHISLREESSSVWGHWVKIE